MIKMKRLFIISFFLCTAIFAYANVAKGNEKTTALLCNKNETINLTQFESQTEQTITGREKEILLHELFNNQKAQNLISSAAAYAYCTYKEEYCEGCLFIPADKNLQKTPWPMW